MTEPICTICHFRSALAAASVSRPSENLQHSSDYFQRVVLLTESLKRCHDVALAARTSCSMELSRTQYGTYILNFIYSTLYQIFNASIVLLSRVSNGFAILE